MRYIRVCSLLFPLLFGGLAAPGAAARAAENKKSITLPEDNAMETLKPGAGVEVAQANCMPCHSTDYIVRQPGGDAKHWQAEVKKMVSVYGAPVSEADQKTIIDYLAAAYGQVADTKARPGPDSHPEAAPEKGPKRAGKEPDKGLQRQPKRP